MDAVDQLLIMWEIWVTSCENKPKIFIPKVEVVELFRIVLKDYILDSVMPKIVVAGPTS